MVDIVLHNNHDAIFMMAMIFIHDFLHDFGDLSGRITSIKSEIQEFRTFISDMAPKADEKPSKKKGGNPDNFFEEEVLDTILSETGDVLQNWILFLKTHNISDYFPGEEATNIQTIISIYESLLIGPNTRSRSRAIQIVQDFIYETKLYVYGLIYSEESQTGGEGELIVAKPNDFLKIKRKLEPQFVPQYKKKPQQGNFAIHCDHMRTAFDKAIYKFSDNEDIVRYFRFMKKLYLYYEDEDKNPYTTFNNSHIENALILYLLDTKNEVIENSNTHFILESLQLQYMLHFNKDKMNGGAPQDIITYIDSEFANELFVILGAGKVDELYSEYNEESANDRLKTKIQSLIERVNSDAETIGILNRKNYDMNISIVESKYANYKIMVERGDRKTVTAKKDFVSAAMNLLKYIYNTVFQHIENIAAKLNAEISKSASKSLSAEQKEGPQMILVTVAKGGKEYILANLDKTHPDFNSVLKTDCDIIDHVSSSKKFTTDTIDNNIKDAFIKYATEFQSNKILKSQTAIRDVITEKKNVIIEKNKKLNVIAINNAATDALIDVGIDKDHHICPTSSVCDAQGSFGSCPPLKTISNREFYPMDFKIKNRDESIFYHGRTELKKKNRITEAKITFSAEVNNFFLPEVQIDIDITEKHAINVLGANENYKELLNTIVSIWSRIFKKKPSYELSPNMLWAALQKDTVFTEFVSAGAVKSVGDLFQEVNSVAQLAGYDSSRITPKTELDILTKKINGEFRVGANGDRPSGVRAGYMLLKSISGINDKAMAGYFSTGVGPFAIRGDIPTDFSLKTGVAASSPTKAVALPKALSKAATSSSLPKRSYKDWDQYKVKDLKDIIRERNELQGKNLSLSGNKPELIDTLMRDDGTISGGTRKNLNTHLNKTRKYMKNRV